MNLLVILITVLILWRIIEGWKTGFAAELNKLVSLVVALFVLSLAVMVISSFMDKDYKNGTIAVILIMVVGLVLRLVNILLHSVMTIARLPILNILNRLLGIGVGFMEVIVAAWIMYTIIETLPTGPFGEHVMKWTLENEYLLKIYNANFIIKWINGI